MPIGARVIYAFFTQTCFGLLQVYGCSTVLLPMVSRCRKDQLSRNLIHPYKHISRGLKGFSFTSREERVQLGAFLCSLSLAHFFKSRWPSECVPIFSDLGLL
ncbi:hypothetical protein HOY80DRAFT_949304 [Tuber brumale]|nr:hypothetical protein HOY80DRAFT_949304 [Tuber brumale]